MATKMLLFAFLAFIPLSTCSVRAPSARAVIYRAVTSGNPTLVIGVLNLTERSGVVTINGNVNGLPTGPHGFHVHEFGDLGNGCLAAGDHYNPFRTNHGGPANSLFRRHVGDLGNIVTPANGTTMVNIRDSVIAFTGTRGIVGRAFVIDGDRDNLGIGGNQRNTTIGNTGARLACGIITYVMPGND